MGIKNALPVGRHGFTFIEIIVVIGAIGLVLPVLFSIIFTIIQQQTKVIRLTEVKRQGDYSLNIMENTIRNFAITTNSASPATSSNRVCAIANSSYSSTSLYFLDKFNNTLGFALSSQQIASNSSIPSATANLTQTNVIVNNFSIGCGLTANYSTPLISVSFDICYKTSSGNCSSNRAEETAALHYQTDIKLRSY